MLSQLLEEGQVSVEPGFGSEACNFNLAFCFAVLANNVLQTLSVVLEKVLGVLRVMETITMHSARRFSQVLLVRLLQAV